MHFIIYLNHVNCDLKLMNTNLAFRGRIDALQVISAPRFSWYIAMGPEFVSLPQCLCDFQES
jgi:hypothetical protein